MKKDIITKEFTRDSRIFADLFNQYLYGGREVIRPEQLRERDTTELGLPYGEEGASVPVQKFRDVRKLYGEQTDGKMRYVLYGLENQTETSRAMAVRNNLYDALAYAEQADEAARTHRLFWKKEKAGRKEPGETQKEALPGEVEEGNGRTEGNTDAEEGSGKTGENPGAEGTRKPDSGEFLSGFLEEDRLIPVVTLTVLWSAKEWDVPVRLSELMDVPDPVVAAHMNDYRMNLTAPGMMSDEEIGRYRTELREVMLFLKYSQDRKKLEKMLEENRGRYEKLERRAVEVIEAAAGIKMNYRKEEATVDVCKAIQEMKQEAEQNGYQRGEQDGYQRGEQNGYQLGERQAKQEMARNLHRLGVGIDTIAQGAGYTADVIRQWLELA